MLLKKIIGLVLIVANTVGIGFLIYHSIIFFLDQRSKTKKYKQKKTIRKPAVKPKTATTTRMVEKEEDLLKDMDLSDLDDLDLDDFE